MASRPIISESAQAYLLNQKNRTHTSLSKKDDIIFRSSFCAKDMRQTISDTSRFQGGGFHLLIDNIFINIRYLPQIAVWLEC